MGIPKFYRWTSERYPCLYEKIREYQIPEFDNLYLDMNGIIHNCSHPNDEDVHLRIPEEHIFRDIFHYIDFLFRMIKPCQVFFMAIDGVAPRAKMNQQRGRRFRSARVAEEQEAEAIKQGEKLPTEDRFDSNCITPGTEFMARLHEQLKYFVSVKISTDPLWQRKGLVVYLSGHDVPGEGEHKIMDFIRHIRSQPDYNPETRHCLYGLDADLMMLGLSTHELRFSLLREEVKFTKPKKKKPIKSPTHKKSKNKDEPAQVVYTLTNVSVFSTDTIQQDSILKPPVPVGDTRQSDKSFLDAISTVPVPEIKMDTWKGVPQAAQEDAPPPPPAANDASAKGDYKAPLPEKTTFFLLHLSLFRDYLDEEFKELRNRLKDHPTIKYDLECVIDDWILMNILVGNDFVPHLPSLHIVKGALPMLYRTYMDILPGLDGYLNENGHLNLKRFEKFITRLSQFDLEQFRDTYDDMKYKASKTGKNIVLGEKMFEDFIFEDHTTFEEEELEPVSDELKALAKRTEDEIFGEIKNGDGGLMCKEVFPDDEGFFAPDDTEEFRLEFLQHKRNYYLTKCEFEKVDRVTVQEFAQEYVRAIQWVLLYYYKGVSSWGWFYPSHYAPFSSDLRGFGDYKIEFAKGQPFKPFEQLLAVLPSQSKKLLPSCYQWLMTEDNSPILDYYPKKFEQDLNGKRQDWEAVVLIPFIDESKLLTAMLDEASKLSQEEIFRNLRGSLLCYRYTKEATGPIKSHRDVFPELEVSHFKLDKIDEVDYNPELLPKGLHPKTKINKIYQGFPSLKSKSFESTICKADVKVFEFYAREESLILSFESFDEDMDGLSVAKKVLGKSVWVNWPHLESALVSAVFTRNAKYILGRDGLIIKDPKVTEDASRKTFDVMAKGIVDRHLKFRGIRLGNLQVILNARLMEGRKTRCNNVGKVIVENQWSKMEMPFALKTTIFEERVTEMFYMDEETAKTYIDLFKKGDQVFYLGDKLFGALGIVTGHDKGSGSVIVDLDYPHDDDEGNLKMKAGLSQLKSQDFFPPYVAAAKCHISSFALSRLTGRVLVSVEKKRKQQKKHRGNKLKETTAEGVISVSDSSDSSEEDFPALEPEYQKLNIGLDLKFNKTNMEVRGYTSKRDGQWFYSANAVKLVNEYVCEFPDIVELLGRADKNKDVYNAADIFPDDPEGRTMEIVNWLDDKGVRNLPRIPTNCNVLDDDDIDNVWNYILSRSSKGTRKTGKNWSVRPNLLYKPGLDKGCIAPVPNAQVALLDRVTCVDRGSSIPLGTRGTIVGIQAPPKNVNDDNEESFKIVSAEAQSAYIIMCDPITDMFEPKNSVPTKENGELTQALSFLLRVNGTQEPRKQEPQPPKPKPKPKLVKLFPYQIINLTQGAGNLREDLKNIPKPSKSSNQKSQLSSTNGTVIISLPNSRNAQSSTTNKTPLKNGDVKILQKPYSATGSKAKEAPKIPPLIPKVEPSSNNQSKSTLPWPPQPMSRSITVEQLFAQAAKSQTNDAIKKDDSRPAPVKILRNPLPREDTANKVVNENKPQVQVKKRQPAFVDQLKNSAYQHKSSGSTKVFVNSSLKKERNKNENQLQPETAPRKSENRDSKSSSAGHKKQDYKPNQLLDLLYQPKNVERVNTAVNTTNIVHDLAPTPAKNTNHPVNVPANNIFPIQAHVQLTQHPAMVPIITVPNQVPFAHPLMAYNPSQSSREYYVPAPYPVSAMPGRNPMASAFAPPQGTLHFPGMPVHPNMFPPPPPPHWTQNRNRSDNSKGHRQTRGSNTNNVFVPLQVSRSMAGGEPTLHTTGKRNEPAIQPEVELPVENLRISHETVAPIPDPDPPLPVPSNTSSVTLKALLGVGNDSPNETVPQQRKSRIAANFFGKQQ